MMYKTVCHSIPHSHNSPALTLNYCGGYYCSSFDKKVSGVEIFIVAFLKSLIFRVIIIFKLFSISNYHQRFKCVVSKVHSGVFISEPFGSPYHDEPFPLGLRSICVS